MPQRCLCCGEFLDFVLDKQIVFLARHYAYVHHECCPWFNRNNDFFELFLALRR